MINYKQTGKYSKTPAETGQVYVGSQAQTGYSGRSTRVDDNFTYLAGSTGGPTYGEGTAISIDTNHNISVLLGTTATTAAYGNHTHSYSDLTSVLTAGDYINIANNAVSVILADIATDLPVATTSVKGLLSASDKTKLDGIATGANNYVLPIATNTTLGGFKVGDNLTIDATTGVLDATDTTYADAIASVSQSGGYHGLMTAVDKEKLNSVAWGADNVEVRSTDNGNGAIWIDGSSHFVYVHPAYTSRTGVSETGKVIKDFSIDATGHVTSVIKANEQGVSLAFSSNAGTVITGATYLQPTLTLNREQLGNVTLGVINTTSTVYTDITATDDLALALKKLQNRADAKLHFRGTIGTGGTYPSIPSNKYNGDVYKIVSGISLSGQQLVAGDMIIYDGPNTTWVVIPSGIRNTWRPINIKGTEARSSEPDSGVLNFAAGDGVDLSWDTATGSIIITAIGGSGSTDKTYTGGTGILVTQDETHTSVYHINCSYTAATSTTMGLLSAADKAKLDGIATGATAVIVDSTLSGTSTNAIQNKAVYDGLATKQNTLTAGTNISITGTNNDTINCTYSLPIATSSTLGGVKTGTNISIDSTGVISANYAAGTNITIDTSVTPNTINSTYTYTLPIANASAIGGVKGPLKTTDTTQCTIDSAGGIWYTPGSGGGSYTGLFPINISNNEISVDNSTTDIGKYLKVVADGTGSKVIWDTVSGSTTALADLTDVNIDTPINGDILKYDTGSNPAKWKNTSFILSNMEDTDITSEAVNNILIYTNVGTTETPEYKWKNKALSLVTLPDVEVGSSIDEGSVLTYSSTRGTWEPDVLSIPIITGTNGVLDTISGDNHTLSANVDASTIVINSSGQIALNATEYTAAEVQDLWDDPT